MRTFTIDGKTWRRNQRVRTPDGNGTVADGSVVIDGVPHVLVIVDGFLACYPSHEVQELPKE